MPKRPPPLKGEDLRRFRSKISRLKKWGVVSRIDARSAKPSQIRQGRNLSDWIDRYDDELSGKATPIPLTKFSKSQLKTLRREYEVKDKRFLSFPHAATEQIAVKKGEINIARKSGIHILHKPVPYENLLSALERLGPEIQKQKGSDRYVAYQIFGNPAWHKLYTNPLEMADDLIHGTVSGAGYRNKWEHLNKAKQKDVYGHIVVFSFQRKNQWPKHIEPEQRKLTLKKTKRPPKKTTRKKRK